MSRDHLWKPGQSGNPNGRPKGSKNKLTLLKIAIDERFRDGKFEKIEAILNNIIDLAMEGDRAAMKMVWDATISKNVIQEDKNQAQDMPEIRIVHQDAQGAIIDKTGEDDE